MDYRLICRFLGVVSNIIGISMVFSLPWAFECTGGDWEVEQSGFLGLLISMLICFAAGAFLRFLGRSSVNMPLRREAMAIVALSWVLATIFGALPYLLSGTKTAPDHPMSIADAIFETESGLSTTGASIMSELEDPTVIPRTILFWRHTTIFLGGLGFMLLFVALLGQGTFAKTFMRFERSPLSGSNPDTQIKQIATFLFKIYIGLNVLLTLILCLLGVSFFDALCHSFSTLATGGFSTFNDSIGHFALKTDLNAPLIEYTLLVFMLIGGSNLLLIYWCFIGQPKYLFRDEEWRTYLAIILSAGLLVFFFGVFQNELKPFALQREAMTVETTITPGEKDPIENANITSTRDSKTISVQEKEIKVPLETAFRTAMFQIVSLMTTTGFCTAQYEDWNGRALFIIILVTIIGGCSGSTSGGTKVVRWIVAAKAIREEIEHTFRPSVVRSLKLRNQILDKETISSVLTFLIFFFFMIVLTTFILLLLEPNTAWVESGRGVENKLVDLFSASLASYSTIGPGLGIIGSQDNYGLFSDPTKLVLSLSMLLGRLELYIIIILFVPAFWKQR